MKGKVLIAGAGDAVGKRLAADFRRMGYAVAGLLFSAGEQAPPELEVRLEADPLDHAQVKEAAAELGKAWDGLDILAVNVDGTPAKDWKDILDEPDYVRLKWAYDFNTLGALRIIDAFFPLLGKGRVRRLCLVTTRGSSNNDTRDCIDFPGHISRAPLNMAVNQLFNKWRPEGYTFRVYCKDPEAGPEAAGAFAAEYFARGRSNEPESYKHSDENRLVMRDWMNIEVPW